MNDPLSPKPLARRVLIATALALVLPAIAAIGLPPLPATATPVTAAATVTTAEEDTTDAEEPADDQGAPDGEGEDVPDGEGEDVPDGEGEDVPDGEGEDVLDEPAPAEGEPAPPQDDGGPDAETVVTMVAIVLMALLILAHALYRDPSRRGH